MTQEDLFPKDQQALTLEAAKKNTFANAEKGLFCPCCEQFVKIYRRKLNSAMAVALIAIYRHFSHPENAGKWLHVPNFLTNRKMARADEAKLVHWELLMPVAGPRDDGSKRNGLYQITEKGVKFVLAQIRIPRYVYLYNQSNLGFSDGQKYPEKSIDIYEALSERFNYRELMEDDTLST